MSRTGRIIRNIAIGIAALIVIVVVGIAVLLNNSRFQNYIRGKIVTAITEGTGGNTEIGTFTFDPAHLHAHIDGLVIHGREPAGSAPFARVAHADVYLHLFGSSGIVGVSSLLLDQPDINVMVLPDGTTNLPTPRSTTPSKNTPLETIVDLAIGQFEIRNGALNYDAHSEPLNVKVENLHAQLWYHLLKRDYEGRISMQPIDVTSSGPKPVGYTVTLPLVLERDAIRLSGATISTSESTVHIDAAMENLRQPRFSGHISGRVTLADLRNTLGLTLDTSRNDVLDLDAVAASSGQTLNLSSLHVALGQSAINGQGTMAGPGGPGSFKFNGQLALAELARITRASARPRGELLLEGEASFDSANQYRVFGHVSSRGLAVEQGSLRIPSAALASDIHLTPATLDLDNLRLDAFGGEFAGNAHLENFARYNVTGSLRHFDIAALSQLAGRQLPYSGAISGPVQASGDLKTPGARSLDARANLNIAPGARGIPVQGSLQADYSGSQNDVTLRNSWISLPHTRLTLAGSVQHGLQVSLVSQNLADILAVTSSASNPPIVLVGGQASVNGAVTGTLSTPRFAGQLAVNRFQVQGRQFDSFTASVAVSPAGATVTSGSLARGNMLASFSGKVGMHDWSPAPSDPLTADVTIRNADLADLMVLAGQPNQDFSGALVADAHINGTVGDPAGSVTAHVENGSLRGEPFDRLDTQINLASQVITVQSATLVSGSGRATLTAQFHHPRDSFSTGQLQAHLQTNQVDLARLRTVQNQTPGTSGQVQVTADVAGDLGQEFLLTNVNADINAHTVRYQGQSYGDLQATARTSGKTATINLTSDFAGSKINVHATTQLVNGYPTDADAEINGLPVESALAAANRTDIPVKGKLSATAHVRNATAAPEGDATFTLSSGAVEGETIDRLLGNVTYTAQRVDLSKFDVASGPSHIALTAQFDHPAGHFDSGTLQFRISGGHIDLAKSRNIQSARPGLAGVVQIDADGSAKVGAAAAGPGAASAPRVLLTSLNGKVSAANLTANGQQVGSLNLNAQTAGQNVTFRLNSDLAGATLQASGNGQLSGAYPLDAQLSFSNVKWSRIQDLLGTANAGPAPYEVTADGKASFNGPVLEFAQGRGSLEIDHLQLQTQPPQAGPVTARRNVARSIALQNQGPIQATLEQGTVRLTNFHFTGPQTDIQASGTVSPQTGAMNLTVNAGADLALIQNFSPDITSSGSIKLNLTARGTFSNPQAVGQLELHNANVNYAGVSNGLSNANGTIAIAGNRASIQNLTAESGGGKITLSGFATFGDVFRFAVRANASNVRVRAQEGVSIVIMADLHGSGTMQHSTVTGTVTVQQLNYLPQSDIGSILTASVPNVETSTTPSPLLDNMKLDIHVITSPALRVKASLAENLQTNADLRIRGSASQPSMLGRIDITQGQLVFFGNKYTVNTGAISFFNPIRIDPVLNLSLETQSQGVDVVLNVTGPIDNMKLAYTSDPPLPFQEIIGLLSTGATPTSDPVVLANQPAAPPQSVEQRGESAVVGQAVANPVANRLQRVFGITQLKIDPAFTGSSALPTAQVTLQQKVSNQITFTYSTALDNPNSTLIQAEWEFNPRWSATAVRDQNGIFSINLIYKKKFH